MIGAVNGNIETTRAVVLAGFIITGWMKMALLTINNITGASAC